MNNITNTMCRLSTLTQEQIDNLLYIMPYGQFDFNPAEKFIGFYHKDAGTWAGFQSPTIVTYTEMMQLLKGKDMNKQTAQEQIVAAYVEINRLQAIIDKPEAKTGRVMSVGDLKRNSVYYSVSHTLLTSVSSFGGFIVDTQRIESGTAFHDEQSAEKYLEYLKLEQELRRAQIAGGEDGVFKIVIDSRGNIITESYSNRYHKISFTTAEARTSFRTAHTDEQLTLLIRGV